MPAVMTKMRPPVRHGLGLALFQHDQVERLVQLQARVQAVRAVGFQVVNFGEDPAQTANVDGLLLELARLEGQRQRREDLLRAAQREGGNEHAALALKCGADGSDEPLELGLAAEVRGRGAAAARGFHDQDIGFHILETRSLEDGLIPKAHVAGVEERLPFPAHQHPGGTQRVPGIEEFERGGSAAATGLLKAGPLDFPVVFEALEQRRDLVHFVVRIQRVVLDARFLPLALHHVDGVVQHTLHEEVAQLRHQNVGAPMVPHRHRQPADVIVVAVSDGDGIELLILHEVQQGQRGAAFQLGVDARVHEQAVAVQFEPPRARANVSVGI